MNDSENKKKELEEAGTNTAHVALKAGAEALAPGVGGKVYNIASKVPGVKGAVHGVEKLGGKVIAKTPVVGEVNKKLNDSGAVDVADKAVDVLSGSPSSKAKGLTGGNNLRKPTGNVKPRQSNLTTGKGASSNSSSVPNALQRNKTGGGFLNRSTINSTSNTQTEDNELSSDTSTSTESSQTIGAKKSIALFVKLIPLLLPIIIVVFVVFLIISVIFPGSALASTWSLNSYNTNEPELVYNQEQDPDNYEAEVEYNEAIRGTDGIVQKYQDKYGVTIDWLLLHNVLKYRYTIVDDDELYTDDGNDEISEEEIDEKIDELDSDDDSSSSSSFDYGEASKKIKTVATLMIFKNDDGTYSTDNEVGGKFYNALIESKFLTDYYEDFLVDDQYETKKALVDEIFEQYEMEKEILNDGNTGAFLGDNMRIYMQTCKVPYTYKTNERGKRVFNNPGVNEGTEYPPYLSLTDYLKGVVLAESGAHTFKDENREGLKAFVIAATNVLFGSFGVDFYPGVQEIGFPSGDCRQLTCDPNYGCSYDVDGGYSTTYTGLNRSTQRPGWKKPLNESQQEFLDGILDEVFGKVMVKKGITPETFTSGDDLTSGSYYESCQLGHHCLNRAQALEDGKNGMTYEEILKKYYGDTFDIIDIKEGLYVEEGNYSNSSYNGNVIFFDQGDYHQSFCSRNNATISSSGCGVTSAAIVVASFTGDRTKDPIYFSNMAKSTGDCGYDISGTDPGFFKKVANRFNLQYQKVGASGNAAVLNALKTGKSLVIAHMGKGHFTGGGHYIVLSAVNEKGQVYVYDPNTKNGRGGNGWYSFNDIVVPELRGDFHIFTKN